MLLVAALNSSGVAYASEAPPAATGAALNSELQAPPGQGTIPPRRADLAITKTGAQASDLITFTLVITNSGPSVAQNVLMVDRLPPQTVLISAQPSLGSCVPLPVQRSVACGFGNLAAGQVATVTIVTQLRPNVSPAFVRNVSVVLSSTADEQMSNNVATAIVRVN
jgi:uncharacterized repeat protein (TIGR01451 family)